MYHNGKKQFSPESVGYVTVGEGTATVVYIQSQAKNMWGEQYTVCTSEGLEIQDSEATRGT
jgi:hypothetical protein